MSKEHYLNLAASAVANYPRLSEDDRRSLTAEVQKIVSDAYDQVPFSDNGAAVIEDPEKPVETPVETPATETPVTETPAVETPATETPVTETPAVETPATETPATETPAVETPATENPATETPAVETPATETPASETPTTETPVEGGATTPGESTNPGDPTTTQSGEVTLDMIWSKLVSLETRIQAVEDFQKL